MPAVRTWSSATFFCLSLFATSLVFQPGAFAQAESAYPAQIAAFTLKLEEARNTQADLNDLVACLDRRDTDLVQQRDKLETRLGELRTEERDLIPKVQSLDAAYKQYAVNFEAAQKNVIELRNAFEKMPGRKLHERHKKDCASRDPWDQMACGRRMGRDIFGHFDKMEARINDASKREQIALGSMNAEKQHLDETEHLLTTTRGQLYSIGSEIGETEKAISNVKQSLSDVRGSVQPLRIQIEAFTGALNEAKDVNLADERPRTLRKLGDLAMEIDATVARGRGAVLGAEKTLGGEWKKICGVR